MGFAGLRSEKPRQARVNCSHSLYHQALNPGSRAAEGALPTHVTPALWVSSTVSQFTRCMPQLPTKVNTQELE